jgi:nicotinamidase-related amidase
MGRVLPGILELAGARPERTVFTRFIPLDHAEQGIGTWRRYYQRWSMMTLDTVAPDLVELIPALARFVPPAKTIDKYVYSPWQATRLDGALRSGGIDTVIVTGGETDVCVLSTVLGAIDLGYRVVLVEDALCSSSDETHDALMTVYASRYSQQVELVSLADVLQSWR